MKRIIFAFLIFISLFSEAQTWTKVNGRWEYQYFRFDNTIGTFTPPQDTITTAPVGSFAVKNDVLYVKSSSGLWVLYNQRNIDVFLVAGQSNAKGHGDSTLSPRAITGKVLQINSGIIKDANDPVGQNISGSNEQSQYGSAWPSFGNTYYNRTGHTICMIPSYKGGTSQTCAADVGNGNWDTCGVLFDSAVARVKNSMVTLVSKGYNPIFKGVVWLQGESDAAGIQNSLMTQTDYINAFKKMLRKFRQNFGASMPFYIIRIGTSTSYIDSYWQQIRDAQQSVANSDSMTQIVYYNAVNFFNRGLMNGDALHFNQVALNEIGQMSAYAVTSHNRNIWQPQGADIYYANSGVVSIGAAPTEDYNLEINASRNNSHTGIKIMNPSTGTSAFAAIKLYNDAGQSGFIFASSSTNTVFPPAAFTFGSIQSGGIRISATAGDITFSKLASAGAEYGKYVFATGNYLFNTTTDNVANGKFQINSTSWFNGLMKLSAVTAPPSTYNMLVHGLTDSGVYQIPVGVEVNSYASTYVNYTTTATYQNVTSISLSAGDWDINAFGTFSTNSATLTAASDAIFVVSTTTASSAGASEGQNIAYIPQSSLLGTSHESVSIPPYRVSVAGTTTYYLNTQSTFTVGNPQFVGGIRAIKIK